MRILKGSGWTPHMFVLIRVSMPYVSVGAAVRANLQAGAGTEYVATHPHYRLTQRFEQVPLTAKRNAATVSARDWFSVSLQNVRSQDHRVLLQCWLFTAARDQICGLGKNDKEL
jgi:hypothetical protein